MTPKEPSLDELIAEYMVLADDGQAPDIDEFLKGRESLRAEFLDFLQLSGGVERLTRLGTTGDVPSGRASGACERKVGPYVLREIIASGGMGIVYKGYDADSGRHVAVKFLRHGARNRPSYRHRFKREAIAIAALEHPHVVPLFDSGTDEDGAAYLAMQLIDGVSLDCVIAQHREARDGNLSSHGRTETPISKTAGEACAAAAFSDNYFANAARCLVDVAEALHAAHETGIVHRDVKPSNILLDVDGKAWLTDFGLASLGEDVTELTMTGDVLGTPAYMSPEQASGKADGLDRRVDVYGLGITLYELATGRRPFTGTREKVLRDVVEGNVQRPRNVDPNLPAELDTIICRAIATSPRDRYSTAQEMADDLRRFADGRPVSAKRLSTTVRFLRWCERKPGVTLATCGGILLAIGSAFAVQSWHQSTLRELNGQLEKTNRELADTNNQLIASQQRLSRELYVADMNAAFEAYNERDIPATRSLLDRYRDVTSEADPRGTPWYLLDRLTQTPSSHLLCQHDGAATEVALSSDGSYGISVGHDGSARRFTLTPSQAAEAQVFPVGGKLISLAMLPNGAEFVTGENIPDWVQPGQPILLRRPAKKLPKSPSCGMASNRSRYHPVENGLPRQNVIMT